MRNPLFRQLILPSARYWATILLFVGAAIPLATGVSAGEIIKAAAGVDGQKTLQPAQGENFVYQYQNRKDPFMPFFTENTTSGSDGEIIDNDQPLSGMQLFEPGQLTLVGLLNKGGEYYAEVEDSTGKGYTLTKGMKIGRRGVIRDIGPGKVLIEETAVTRTGQKLITPVAMALRKEGEK